MDRIKGFILNKLSNLWEEQKQPCKGIVSYFVMSVKVTLNAVSRDPMSVSLTYENLF